MIKALETGVRRDPGISVCTHTRALDILLDNERAVRGLRITSSDGFQHAASPDGSTAAASPHDPTKQLDRAEDALQIQTESVMDANAAILATGGYAITGGELLRAYAPQLAELPSTNGPFATGDGVRMACAAGAEAVQLEQVQLYPTAFIDAADEGATHALISPEDFRAFGAVLLDQQGHRFVNELATRGELTKAIMALPGQRATLLLDAPAAEAAAQAGMAEAIEWYCNKGLMRRVLGLRQVARELNVSAEELALEMESYAVGDAWDDDQFGKTIFPTRLELSAEPGREAFLMSVTPALHYSLGGVRIDAQARVIAAGTSAPIRGLYAAGEVCGGVHGANRLAGNALLDCVVFGRTAGRAAAEAAAAAMAAKSKTKANRRVDEAAAEVETDASNFEAEHRMIGIAGGGTARTGRHARHVHTVAPISKSTASVGNVMDERAGRTRAGKGERRKVRSRTRTPAVRTRTD
jgi:flavocytochrome c